MNDATLGEQLAIIRTCLTAQMYIRANQRVRDKEGDYHGTGTSSSSDGRGGVQERARPYQHSEQTGSFTYDPTRRPGNGKAGIFCFHELQ